ncbi:MAG: efflux RND transporter periplasmic adaptor subunit [candidate division WOR-3 bacterium]|nr:efflux RND transporter periplasmic adaptor subunit [candidate division WOR-3 bacterium]MDW8113792.1 efflux RND transporter periplasmic adaptor subunit [candidate division WOR-3 bacterium]
MKKKIFLIIGILVFIFLIVFLNLTKKEEGKEVEIATVKYGSIVSQISGDGELKAKTQVNIQSQIMGRVEKIFVKEGDEVKKGDLLCLLERKSYEANLTLQKARYEQVKNSFIRIDSLYKKKLISDEEYERAKTEYEVAKASYEDALDKYNKTEIRSPINGTVVKLNIEEGETAIIGTMNNPGTIMMIIADLSKMMAVVEVSERDVVDVKVGNLAKITLDALPDTFFIGFVKRVGYVPITTTTGTEKITNFEVEIELQDTSFLLRPGMSVHCEIITAEKESVLVVPISAIGRRRIGDREVDACFVIEGNKAKLREVKVGSYGEFEVEIIEGLKEGEKVITGPYSVLAKLNEGDLVKPRKRERAERKKGEAGDVIRTMRFIQRPRMRIRR